MNGGPHRLVVRVTLDPIQAVWLDAIAEINAASRQTILRQALRHLIAIETVRVQRTRHYLLLGEVCRAERWDPLGDYIARHQAPQTWPNGAPLGAPLAAAERIASEATPLRSR